MRLLRRWRRRFWLPCARCGGALEGVHGVEAAWCGWVDDRWVDMTYTDGDGRERTPSLLYGHFEVGRVLEAVVESHHDEHGLVWPPRLAPFDVHLVSLARSEEEQRAAERIYALLQEHGFEVLYDDRKESAGVKFADADLIGCPIRVTLGRRSLEQGGVEVKARWSDERRVVPEADLVDVVAGWLARFDSSSRL